MTPRWDTVLRGLCWWEKEIEENRANSFFGRQSKKSLPRAPPLSERIRTASRIWMQNQQVALTKQNTSSINGHLSSRLILINNTTWYYLRKIISCTDHQGANGYGRSKTVHVGPNCINWSCEILEKRQSVCGIVTSYGIVFSKFSIRDTFCGAYSYHQANAAYWK